MYLSNYRFSPLNWAIAVINLRSTLEDPGAELNLILGQ